MGIQADFVLDDLNIDAKLLYFLNLALNDAKIGMFFWPLCVSYFLISLLTQIMLLAQTTRIWRWYFC